MNHEFRSIVRIRVENMDAQDSSGAFGAGTASLLAGIAELNSLNKAAKKIRMSYSKAWNSLRATEAHLGFALIERHGAHGSRLTERGKRFLEVYDLASAAAKAAADSILFNARW